MRAYLLQICGIRRKIQLEGTDSGLKLVIKRFLESVLRFLLCAVCTPKLACGYQHTSKYTRRFPKTCFRLFGLLCYLKSSGPFFSIFQNYSCYVKISHVPSHINGENKAEETQKSHGRHNKPASTQLRHAFLLTKFTYARPLLDTRVYGISRSQHNTTERSK